MMNRDARAEQAPVYNMLQRLSIHRGGSNGFDQSTFAKRQSICPVDSVPGTDAVDLGQQKGSHGRSRGMARASFTGVYHLCTKQQESTKERTLLPRWRGTTTRTMILLSWKKWVERRKLIHLRGDSDSFR